MEFRILQPLEVWDGAAKLPLTARAPRAILAALVLRHGEVVRTDSLIEAVWGERPPSQSLRALHQHVSRLRRSLGQRGAQLVVHEPAGYALRLGASDRIDADLFEQLAKEARAHRAAGRLHEASEVFQQALSLWRGDPLPDFTYDAHFRGDIERLRELHVVVEEEAAEAMLTRGDHAHVLADLRRLVAEHPLRERARAHLMLALYRSGLSDEALQVYEDARQILAHELGHDPGPALLRLKDQITRQDATLDVMADAVVQGGPAARTQPATDVASDLQGHASAMVIGRLALFCAVPAEHTVIRRFCSDLSYDRRIGAELGHLVAGDLTWEVALHATGQTNAAAAAAASSVLKAFEPDLAVFVGVAGGFAEKGLEHLDVVAATSIHLYQSGAAHETLKSRPRSRQSDQVLLDHLAVVAQSASLATRLHFGDVVSGDQLLRSLRSETYRLIRERYDQALAVEMEGFGFLEAAARSRSPALVLRGVSDLLDDKNLATDASNQPAATEHAMQLAVALLESYRPIQRHPARSGRDAASSTESLLLQLGGVDTQQAIAAGSELLQRALQGEIESPILHIRVEPQRHGVLLRSGERSATLSLDELRDSAAEGTERLASAALASLFPVESSSSRQGPRSLAELHASAEGAVRTPLTLRIVDELRRHKHVALVGPSASGKTIATTQAIDLLQPHGWTTTWFDLANPGLQEVALLRDLLETEPSAAGVHLLVLDNFQCNPGLGGRLLELVTEVAHGSPHDLRTLIISWESGIVVAGDRLEDLSRITCFGEDLIPVLASQYLEEMPESETVGSVRRLSKGDLLIARLACERWRATGAAPGVDALAAAAYEAVVGESELTEPDERLLYHLAALGQFEVEPRVAFAKNVDADALRRLLGRGAVRRNGEYLTVGHRTQASLLCAAIRARRPELEVPLRLTVEYLQASGDEQIIAMLERLDLAEIAQREIDHHGTAFLARAWDSIRLLERELAHQVDVDATWGDNLASAIFAGQALARFHEDHWQRIAEFVRARWRYGDGRALPEPSGQPTAERIDFDEIAKRMQDEDELGLWPKPEDTATGIDRDRMHQTWALGLLLGFEGAAPNPDARRLRVLKDAAAAAQEAEGYFYPRRVPWVTARVVIGLTLAGETIRTSATVRAACDWLRRRAPDGLYEFGSWPSGTGTWNTRTLASAMCLTALIYAGVSLDDPVVQGGIAYLRSQHDDWLAPGQEIDAADAMETLILTGTRWRELQSELLQVVAWARDRDAWRHASLSAAESQDESSKVSKVANSLTALMWATVKSELPLLLEGLSVDTAAHEVEPDA